VGEERISRAEERAVLAARVGETSVTQGRSAAWYGTRLRQAIGDLTGKGWSVGTLIIDGVEEPVAPPDGQAEILRVDRADASTWTDATARILSRNLQRAPALEAIFGERPAQPPAVPVQRVRFASPVPLAPDKELFRVLLLGWLAAPLAGVIAAALAGWWIISTTGRRHVDQLPADSYAAIGFNLLSAMGPGLEVLGEIAAYVLGSLLVVFGLCEPLAIRRGLWLLREHPKLMDAGILFAAAIWLAVTSLCGALVAWALISGDHESS
jgi:hypothetical protein